MHSEEIKNILSNHKQDLLDAIINNYKQREIDFWRILKESQVRISEINKVNFLNSVDSFLDLCITHIPDNALVMAFNKFSEDAKDSTVDKVTQKLTTAFKNKNKGDNTNNLGQTSTQEGESIEPEDIEIDDISTNYTYQQKITQATEIVKHVKKRASAKNMEANNVKLNHCIEDLDDGKCNLPGQIVCFLDKESEWDDASKFVVSVVGALQNIEVTALQIKPANKEKVDSDEQRKIESLHLHLDTLLKILGIPNKIDKEWKAEVKKQAPRLLERSLLHESSEPLRHLFQSISYLKRYVNSKTYKTLQQYHQQFPVHIIKLPIHASALKTALFRYIETGTDESSNQIYMSLESLKNIVPFDIKEVHKTEPL